MSDLLVATTEGITTITLNRPDKRNAINEEIWLGLERAFVDAGRDPSVRVVVVTGAGGSFCSGQDLTPGARPGPPLQRMRRVADVAVTLHRLPKPTLARVDGVAAGAGANLALACDLVIASQRSRFIQIFAARGLSLDFGGSWLLPRRVGMAKAKELALLAEPVDADAAVAMGMINRAVPDDDLDAVVDDWARRLATGPTLALSHTKRLLDLSPASSFEQAVEAEGAAQVSNQASADTVEAMTAFLERRSPRFTGR
jgi:enoyl-CoA hydratase/carnithine racemase